MNSSLNTCRNSCGAEAWKSGVRSGLTALMLVLGVVFFTCGMDVYAALSVNKSQTVVLSGFTCGKSGVAGNAEGMADSMAKIKTGNKAKSADKKGPRKFGSSCVKLSRASFTYDGKAKKPAVKVTYGGKKLKKDRDYKVFYKNNVRRGKASVTVEGRGDYRGSKVTKKFRIK